MDNNGTHPTRLKKTIAWVLLFLYLGQPLAAQAAQAAKHSSQRPVSKLTRPPRAPRPETSQYPITPTGKNPSIDYAANGVRVIYINKPTGSGISHNQYQDFNVGPTGLILDNAYNITLTELGGYIQGNPNLANGSARIILNEVTGPHLSRLNGYTEIAGKQAELIIANPNGITGDGFGFINTSRATLTTGSPVFDPSGSLGGFQVTDGQIAIQGDGLNAANIDRVDLISRTTQINAGIWANQLNIVTGANDVSYQTLDAKKLDIAASEPPAVSLDVGQLGGMYANKILLIGTEQGVGVHSQGTVMADSDLTITQDGKLILAGSTQAQGNITIHSQDLTQEGNLYAQGNTQITTAGAITNSGILAAGNNASLNAQTIQSSQLLAAGLNADGALGAHGNLSLISRDQAQLSGQQSAAQNITIQAGAIDLTQASTSAGQQITLTAANGSILHQEASLTAGGKATLTATGTIDNTQGAIQTGQGLTLTAAAINNTQGSLLNLDASPLTLDASQTLTNTQGLIGTNGAVTIHAKTLVNRNQGQIIAGETLSLITTGAIDNTQGQINAIGLLDLTAANITNSGGQLAANTDATLTTGSFTQDGTIIAGRDLALSLSQNYTHQAGTQLIAGRNLSLTTTGTLTNSGTLEAVDTLTVSGKNITNQTDASLAAGNTINLQAATGAITNQGRIDSTSVNTQSQTLTNTGGIVGNLITLQADILTNTGSSAIIAATHGVTLLGKTKIQNKSGATLYSQGDIFIAASDQPKPDGSYERTGAFLNDSTSRIEAHRNLSILAETLSNDGLISGEQIYIEGKTIQNNAGKPVTGSQTGDPSQDTPALPGNGLYTVRPEATSQYLVETDPRFTSYEAFTTSDYMLEQLGLDPEATLKRLGDGHYEQKLVRDQITQLTGRRLSDGYESDDQAYKALLENGAQTAKEMNLTVGVALTDDQVKNLSHDMVWMVEKEVQGQKVLVPVVYLANTANKETTSAGGLITGKNVVLKAEGDITNSGAIRASHYTGLEAKNIVNRAGAITGGTTHLKTSEDIRNQSGKISGANVLLDAGRDIKNETLITTTTSSTTKTLPKKHWFSRKTKETTTTTTTTAGPTGSIEASENLTAVAGRDITIAGASLTAGQDLALQAGRNLAVNTVETKDTKTITGKGYSSSQETTTHLQSNIQAGGNATLAAQNDLTLQGANLTAGQDLALQAGRNLAVNAAQQKQSSAENKKKYSHHSQTITNLQSNIQAGGNATLVAQNDLTLRGANLAAQNDLTLAAGGNITVAAVKDRVTEDTKKGSRKNYTYTKTDDESVVGSQLAAGGNITIAAVQLDDPNPNTSANRGNVTIEGSAVQTGQGNIAIAADNNIDIKAASERHETYTETKKTKKRTFSSKTTVKTKRTVENNAIGSIIQAGAASNGNTEDTEPKPTLQITSGKDLTIQGSMVTASGAVQLNAANDVQITSAQDTLTIDTTYSSKKRGALSSKVKIDNQHTAITIASGSLVSGDTVAINAGRDLTVSGSSVAGTGDVALSAKNNLNILSAQDTMTNQRYTYEKTSGLTASFQGGFSLSAGTTSLKTTTDETSVSQVESIVGSQNGTLTLLAGQDATISGSDILGGAGIDLLAQNITIQGAFNTFDSHSTTEFKQNGFTVSLTNNTLQAVQDTYDTVNRMEDIQDDRLKALYGLKAYRSGEKAYDGTKAGYKELQENSKKKNNNSQADATTANTQPNPSANTSSTTTGNNNPVNSGNGNSQPTTGNNSQTNTGDNTPANNNTKEKNEKVDNSFTATVGFSSSKQKTETTTSAATVRGSSLTSSGDINLIATGSGQIDLTGNAVDGDLNILGSSVSGNNVYLSAARDVSLKAQANTTDSIMKSSGGSYGFGASASLGPNSSVSYYLEGSKNSSNSTGHATTWTEAMVTGNANLTMISGRDTNLVGAQAHGDSINLNVGRNLNLASLQDVETYNEKNKSINGKIGIGMASNVGFNKGTMNSTYKSVNEQTGIFAGKGGFDVYVEGNTDLKGAVMASKAEAGKNRLSTGTLTFSDIENEAKYKAKSFGVNYAKGAGVENKDKGWTPNMGVPVSDEKTSTTHAAIAEGTIEIRDQANQKADITKLRRDTENAVNKLDQIFDKKTVQEKQELTKMFGEEAFKAVGDLANAQLKKAIKDKDQESIQRWGKGGSYRVALHAMVGGMMADLGGGNVISGALGAGVSEASRKALSKLSPDLQQWASMAIGGAASKISGGGIQTGASTALSGTRNNYFTHQLQEDFAEDLKNATTKEDQIAVIKEYLSLANRVLGSEAEFANSIEAKEIVDKMTTSIEVAELEDQLKKFPEYDSKYSLEVNIYTILYNNGGKEQLQGALMLGGMMTGSMAVTIATAVGDNALDGKELITPDILLAALVSSKLKVRGAVKGPSATTQIVHLDTNALVRALDRGEVAAIDAALAGRTPVVSITAAKEYLAKGDVEVLRQFLSERGGRIGSATTQAEIDNLIQQANALGRVLKASDASVAGSAIKEGATLITNDARLARFLRAVGFKVEGH